jgi:hypothetical protein
MEYIRKYYNVPAKRGGRVDYQGRLGIITGSVNGYLRIRLDGEKHSRRYHPTWKIKYLSE